MTGAKKSNLSGFYQRVDRFRKRKAEEELADAASFLIGLGDSFEVDASPTEQSLVSDVTASALSSSSASAAASTLVSSRGQRIEAGLANFPSWMNPDLARHSMTRRPRKNLPQAHLSRLVKKMDKTYYSDRYKNAFKAATLSANIPDCDKGKRGNGVDSICTRVNQEMLSSPSDRKLARSTLHRAIQAGEFGISPKKLGRRSKLPTEFTQALAVHSVMMQVSGEGEMSSLKMRTLATAMTLGTPHEGKMTNEHIWKMCRHRHPEYIKPAHAVDNEDRRVDWLTYNNIMMWMKRAKKFVLDIGMAKDEPGIIRKCSACIVLFILYLTSHLFPYFKCRWRPERGQSRRQ